MAIILLLTIALGIACYALAQRFLVPHEESGLGFSLDDARATPSPEGLTITPESGEAENAAAPAPMTAPDPLPQTGEPEITETSYRSANIEIQISGHQRGKAYYYVADIKLTTVKALQCAFAKGKYGRNIVENTIKMAADNEALLATNGDYYGFRGDGIIIRNGELYRNKPTDRDVLVIYLDGHMEVLNEKQQDGYALIEAGAWQTYSFGPALVKGGKAVGNYDKSDVKPANPRTGIGMIAPNHFLLVVVDGRAKGYSEGLRIEAFAKLFEDLGCQVAYNLDGGATSSMAFNNGMVNNALGKSKPRKHSDIIMIKEP